MEQLNKENFFDEMGKECPEGLKVFLHWIDNYKEKVEWDWLFNAGDAPAPKYHDLPGAMQVGIYIELMRDRGGCSYEVDLFEFDFREELALTIRMLEDEHFSD